MLKVMIVDDEILAIQHIKRMIDWERCGFRIVAESVHPGKALDLLAKVRPDVTADGYEVRRQSGIRARFRRK